jgi:hypothetical protein
VTKRPYQCREGPTSEANVKSMRRWLGYLALPLRYLG